MPFSEIISSDTLNLSENNNSEDKNNYRDLSTRALVKLYHRTSNDNWLNVTRFKYHSN